MCVYRHTDARMHAQITRVHGYLGEHPTASRPDYQSDPKKGSCPDFSVWVPSSNQVIGDLLTSLVLAVLGLHEMSH